MSFASGDVSLKGNVSSELRVMFTTSVSVSSVGNSDVGEDDDAMGTAGVAPAAGDNEDDVSSIEASPPSTTDAEHGRKAAAVAVGETDVDGPRVEASASSPPHELPSTAADGIANSTSARRAPVGVLAPLNGEAMLLTGSAVRQKWKVAT